MRRETLEGTGEESESIAERAFRAGSNSDVGEHEIPVRSKRTFEVEVSLVYSADLRDFDEILRNGLTVALLDLPEHLNLALAEEDHATHRGHVLSPYVRDEDASSIAVADTSRFHFAA